MDWREITVHTTTMGSEFVSDLLLQAGAAGTAVQDRAEVEAYMNEPRDWDMIDEEVLQGMSEDVLVQAWFPEDERLADTLQFIRDRLQVLHNTDVGCEVGSLEVTGAAVKDEDWENNWKKYYKPFTVGERLLICPAWEEENDPERVKLLIEPGMAFGTGTHETTFMCLQLGEKYIHGGEEIADVGCGTGILATAALLLGAKQALAIDRDPVAVSAATINARLNDVGDTLDARTGDLLKGVEQKFDLMFANIIAEVVAMMAPDAHAHLKKGAVLICSGIIKEKRTLVEDALRDAGFDLLEVLERGEWVAMAASTH